jgi:deazaflavin-dependent oxidoreductase (nitroreductase family)
MVFARGLAMPSPKTFGIIPVSCFYKSGRATGLGKAFSRFWSAWASFGLPPRRQVGLEVEGRRTGRPHTVAVVIAGYEGEHYLVSMLGECEWVKNVRAQGEAHIISGRRRKVKLEEVPIDHRAPIIKEYVRLAPGGRLHIGLGTTATLADCQRVAPNHPVFRIVFQNGPTRSR